MSTATGGKIEGNQRGLCIATRCATIDEVVRKFARDCDGVSLFASTTTLREVGSEAPFAILLADKAIAMRGWCVVFDAWSTSQNPFGRPGMRLGLHRLTKASRAVFARMNELKAAQHAVGKPMLRGTQALDVNVSVSTSRGMPPVARPPHRTRPTSIQIPQRGVVEAAVPRTSSGAFALGTVPLRKPTLPLPVIEIPPVSAAPPPTPFPRGSTRIELFVPGSEMVPANPLTMLTDPLERFVDCHLYEETQPPLVALPRQAPMLDWRRVAIIALVILLAVLAVSLVAAQLAPARSDHDSLIVVE